MTAMLAVGAFVGWRIVQPTTPPIGQDRAAAIAREFFDSAGAHGPGTATSDVRIGTIFLGADAAGHRVWEVEISGSVTDTSRASPATYGSNMWLYIDAQTGAVTVYAQG